MDPQSATLLPVLYLMWRLENLRHSFGRQGSAWMCRWSDTLDLLRDSPPRSISRSGATKDAPLIWGHIHCATWQPACDDPAQGEVLDLLETIMRPRDETLTSLSGRPPELRGTNTRVIWPLFWD